MVRTSRAAHPKRTASIGVETRGAERRIEARHHSSEPREQHRAAIASAESSVAQLNLMAVHFDTPMPTRSPIAPPTVASATASVRNCNCTSRARACSAMRMPISRVRSITETSITFAMPALREHQERLLVRGRALARLRYGSARRPAAGAAAWRELTLHPLDVHASPAGRRGREVRRVDGRRIINPSAPTKRASQRMEAWRKVQHYGTLPLGNSGYVQGIDSVSTPQLIGRSAEALAGEYQELSRQLAFLAQAKQKRAVGRFSRLRSRLQESGEADSFDSRLQRRAGELVAKADAARVTTRMSETPKVNPQDYKSRVWLPDRDPPWVISDQSAGSANAVDRRAPSLARLNC